jgi:hypothetical protein
MAKEAANDISQPMDQAPLQNVTALHKRDVHQEPAETKSAPHAELPPADQTDTGEPHPLAADEIPTVNYPVLVQKLCEAELMMAHAAETGKKLKPDIIATLTNARDANVRGAWTKALTKQFWSAYSQLCAAIKPVTCESLTACGYSTIVRRYRFGTIGLLCLIVPLSILMFISARISDEINDRIKDNNALVVKLHDQILSGRVQNDPDGQPVPVQSDIRTQFQLLATSNRSLYSLATALNYCVFRVAPDTIPDKTSPEGRPMFELSALYNPTTEWPIKIKAYQDIRAYANDVQQMNRMIYGAITAYLLPILYALLGACAYALRSISQQIRARTYTPTHADFARIIIAVIAGLVVGLFNNFTQGISLSPLAIAFLVGYGVEIFFSFLDTFLETLRKVRSRQLPQRA